MRGWRRKCQDFPSKSSCISVQKNLVGQLFRLSLISVIEKFYASDVYVTISVDILCLTAPILFVEEPSVLHYFRVLKKIMERRCSRRKGVSQCSVEFFLSHTAEKFCRGTLLFCVSEKFRQLKCLWIEGGYQDFPSKVFCLTVLKKFVGEPFSVKLFSGIEKVYV